MKTLFVSVMLACICSLCSCKKNHADTTTLLLLQHKWMVISIDSEALHYEGTPGDYFNFATDGKLYRRLGNMYDTSAYRLSSDGQTLSLYIISNGTQSATQEDFTIRSLNDSQMVISYSKGSIHALDSLKR